MKFIINFFKKKKWMGVLLFALAFFGVIYFVLYNGDFKEGAETATPTTKPTTTPKTGSLWENPTTPQQAMGNLLFNAKSDCTTSGDPIKCATNLFNNSKDTKLVGTGIGIGKISETFPAQLNSFNTTKNKTKACDAIFSATNAGIINGLTDGKGNRDIGAISQFKPKSCT